MKIERKLNINKKSTDMFKEFTGKDYEVKNDHKTYLMVQECLKNAGKKEEEIEKANDKALGLIIGEENWKEIKSKIEELPNYAENIIVAQVEIYSLCYNQPFEVLYERFQKSNTAK